MAPKKANGTAAEGAPEAATSTTDLSTNEQRIMTAAMQALKVPPELDYDKMAKILGYSNSRSASNAWSAIKGKIFNKDAAGLRRGPRAGAKGTRNDKARARIAGNRGKKSDDKPEDQICDASDSDKAADGDSSEDGGGANANAVKAPRKANSNSNNNNNNNSNKKRGAPKGNTESAAKRAKTSAAVGKSEDESDEEELINKQIQEAAPAAEEFEEDSDVA